MKILAIRGKNIASLAGEFSIDYTQEPLRSAGLYAITGQTGAGKSTLLDVLALALYGTTPRLRNAQGADIEDVKDAALTVKDARSLLRRGCVDGYAEVDFVGVDGDHYRVRWSVNRAYKKVTSKLQTPTVTLYNLTKDVASSCKGKREIEVEIVRLTDLTYPQFVRTSLLAQGEFASFLRAADGDKATLLEKLTGTEVYAQISRRVYERCEQAKQAHLLLVNETTALSLLTDEEVAEIQRQIAQLKREEELKRADVDALRSHLDWIKQFEILLETAARNAEQLKSLQEKSALRQTIRDRVQLQDALTPLTGKLESRLANQNQQAALHDAFEHVARSQSEATHRVEGANKLLEEKTLQKTSWEEQIPVFRRKMAEAQAIEGKQQLLQKNLQEKTGAIQWFEKEKLTPRSICLHEQKMANESLEKRYKELTTWFEQCAEKKPIAENAPMLLEYLNQAAVQLARKQQGQKGMDEATKKIGQITTDQQDQQGLLARNKSVIETTQQQLDALQSNQLEQELPQLRTHLKEQQKRRVELLQARGVMDQLLLFATQKKGLKEQLQTEQQGLDALTKELPACLQMSEECRLQWSKKVTFVNDLRLSLSENVVALRSQLREGEPCMVCGSKTHSHKATSDNALSQFLSQQEALLLELEQQKDGAYRTWYAKNVAKQQSVEKIQQIEKQLHAAAAGVEEKENELAAVAALQDASSDTLEERAATIKSQWHVCESAILEEEQRVQEKEQALALANRLKSDLVDKKLALQKQQDGMERMTIQLATCQADLSREEEQYKVAEQELLGLKEQLSRYFTHGQWFDNWVSNPSEFADHIRSFAAKWASQKDLLEQVSQTKTTAQESWQVLLQEVNGLKEQYGQLQADEKRLVAELNPLKDALYALFEDTDLRRVESNHRQREHAIGQEFEQAATALREAKQTIALLEQRKKGLEEQRQQVVHERDSLEQQLDAALQQLNQARETELTLEDVARILDDETLSASRKELLDLQNQLTRADQRVLTAKEAVLTHQSQRKNVLEKPEATTQLTEAAGELARLVDTKATLQVRWDNHQANCVRAEALQARAREARAYYANWAKLSAEIGNADGGAFKKIAQSYTLDLLLRHANEQMKQMAPRYELRRIPESLGLQVVDREMCDQVRSVFSLSGGESFLISLALALGLSSLSSRQMNLESLFIDEGFGSLDQESLYIAMDALESLQLQGRKIGVISHVREMTERIDTRINVNKSKNGISYIEIERA